MDPSPPPPPGAPARRRRSKAPLLALGGVVAVGVAAFLAFGVFGVQALFVDDEVDEGTVELRSGATIPTDGAGGGDPPPPGGGAGEPEPAGEPTVVLIATGTFVDEGHPGEGTANLYSDGAQSVVRFESDFATDNGPDLKVVVDVGGEQVEVAPLKGNVGAQNYELPAGIDPEAVTSVGVWCKRFDYVFTTATFA